MQIEFDKSFSKSLDKIKENDILKKIENVIYHIDEAESLSQIKNVKKLVGFKKYYRIRIGEYRLGFELIDSQTIKFIIICHRKNIYNVFP